MAWTCLRGSRWGRRIAVGALAAVLGSSGVSFPGRLFADPPGGWSPMGPPSAAVGMRPATAMSGEPTLPDGTPVSTLPADSSSSAPQAYLIKPPCVVIWSAEAEGRALPHGSKGTERLGADGMLSLGSHGSVLIAGLTAEQARMVIERHLTVYARNVQAHLTVLDANGTLVAQAAPARTPSTPMRAPASVPARVTVRHENATWSQPAGARPERSLVQAQAVMAGPSLPSARPWPASAGQPLTLTEVAAQAKQNPPTPRKPMADLPPPEKEQPKADESKENQPKEKEKEKAAESAAAAQGPGCCPVTFGSPRPCANWPGGVPQECVKVSLPAYVVEPPDILVIESTQELPDQKITGQNLVRPDGTVGLGIYGSVYVAGLTLEQARNAIAAKLSERIKDFKTNSLYVDVLAYNSKFYYVITDGGGYGEQVMRFPITGNETVLDAISQINGLPAVASKKRIWVARPNCAPDGCEHPQLLPVDWIGITQKGLVATNYQVLPGDRIYVNADKWVRFDTGLTKVLTPIERVFGVTLLGSETVHILQNRSSNSGISPFGAVGVLGVGR